MVFRKYEDSLRDLYSQYTGAENFPTEAKTMSSTEFMAFMYSRNLIDDIVGLKFPLLAYIRSKETQINELDDKRKHRQMIFAEFLEALGRLSFFTWKANNGFGALEDDQVPLPNESIYLYLETYVSETIANSRPRRTSTVEG